MGMIWHLLHLLLWGGCLLFFWDSKSESLERGIRFRSPSLKVEKEGHELAVKANSGHLDPNSFNILTLEDKVSLEWEGQTFFAQSMEWDLELGRLSLMEPKLGEGMSLDVPLLELTSHNRGYLLDNVETMLGIPVLGAELDQIKASRLAIPMSSLKKLVEVSDTLRKPLLGEKPVGKAPVGEDHTKGPMMPGRVKWSLRAESLRISQSRLFMRAIFENLHLEKGQNQIWSKSARAKWGPLRWVLTKGKLVREGEEVSFETGVLFLEDGRLILDRKEVPLP